jgi:coenzyme F420-0:L-glutamate ligase/coenzyme F420-1:gamma-L-glutamate ligase
MRSELYDFLKERRSVRKYKAASINRKQLDRIIEGGIWAPSAHSAQPWRFVIIKSRQDKQRLAEAMGAVFQRDLEQDGGSQKEVKEIVAASIDRFSTAPVLLLTCLTMENMDVYPDDRRRQVEFLLGVQSVSAATQNILLAIHAEGLGGCWCCAPLFCQDVVRDILGLPEEFIPQALITIGVPAETPEPPQRKPVEDILIYQK